MTTLKTALNERPATDTPFTPTSTIPKSNVQEAIEYAFGSVPFSTSAELAAIISDETGTGALMFGTSPTLTTSANLSSGFVFNWNAGDVTLTHSSNSLTFSGADGEGGGYAFGGASFRATHGGVDVASGGIALVLGADGNAVTRTDATTKNARIGAVHYTNAEEPVAVLVTECGVTQNFVNFGGGTSLMNAATDIRFLTAANNTTVTGTEVARFTSGVFRPGADDGTSLGVSGTAWSDLFLASGAVINFNAGDVTITHSADLLTLNGGRLAATSSTAGTFLVGSTSTAYTIGNSAAQFQCHQPGSSGFAASRWTANTIGPIWALGKSRGASVGTNTIVQSGDTLGILEFAGDDGTDLANVAAAITAQVDGTPGTNDMPGRLLFGTTSDGANSATTRMVINSSGGVYPGTNDGSSLGISGTAWSDLFLASGAVINFNAGNLTMTHSAGALAITGVTTVASATATPAGGSTSARLLFGTTAGFGIYYGSGAPTVSAAQGSLYLRSDGSGTADRLYVNTNGTTGWTNFTSAT